MIADICIGRT